MIWYELMPLDTLFFRGAIPLETGLPVSDVLFPPPPSVIKGAIWTAGKQDFSKDPSVKIHAILLKKDDIYYAQAPYSWFIKKSENETKKENEEKVIICAKELEEKDTICSVNGQIPWVKECGVKNIGGKWVDIEILKTSNEKKYKEERLFENEDRVGIGIDYKRKSVEKGKLFMARHIRLHQGVSIAIAIDDEYGLGEKGVLQLGGERRMCRYEKIKTPPKLPSTNNGNYYVLTAPTVCTEELLDKVFAAKTFITSGWRMRKQTHKDSQTWFCAGSVFTEKIGDECIALSQ
ncbi:MAG: hypothetical protein LBT96_03565 [Campylobacteraceae bacterium]|jgi:CRISPR type III-B/RAMP module-associated protein Cmr3|nr:hypothetical protein [Campylobacteraceae bacterium]